MEPPPDISKLTEGQLRELLDAEPGSEALLDACKADRRVGVRRLAATADRRAKKVEREKLRLHQMLSFERQLAKKGYTHIAGVDEVGRGPLAGPVVAACVILPFERPIDGVDDSKKLTPERRELLDDAIRQVATGVGISAIDNVEIDHVNIHQASLQAMRNAIATCAPETPECLLIDAMKLPDVGLPQISLIHGDERSYAIAAASIVAKVFRDRLMVELDAKYPHYRFASNKGYGTADHLEALERHGPCEIHRRSFAPVMAYALPSVRLFLEQIGRASSPDGLRKTGLRIRASSSNLTAREIEILRQAYRERLEGLGVKELTLLPIRNKRTGDHD